MCVLALAWNVHPRWRLLLAGNRDEFHERPTAALSPWESGGDVLAGRDLRSGGTWAGLDRGGRMAVVTNVRDPRIVLPQAPSRGRLTTEFLTTAGHATRYGQALLGSAVDYAPFNLLVSDAVRCEFISNYPAPRQMSLSDGVHGLSNGDLDEPWPKTRRLAGALADWLAAGESDLEPLWRALTDETPAPDDELPDTGLELERERMLSAIFIRDAVYGTRASTLIAIGYDGQGWISERRFNAGGEFTGETTLSNNN
ncbi:NRDE family protein [Pseudoxanthomonas sp. UTMC 1351]|uniref:NRDE family protein n=1 Tax=Pseudoxanthomonas sp. UTMC 1351 TaxID=2695853 RepID=UPI0034CD628F